MSGSKKIVVVVNYGCTRQGIKNSVYFTRNHIKADLYETLDKLSPVLAGIVTVIFCIMIIKGM